MGRGDGGEGGGKIYHYVSGRRERGKVHNVREGREIMFLKFSVSRVHVMCATSL